MRKLAVIWARRNFRIGAVVSTAVAHPHMLRLVLLGAGLALAGCHAGNKEAKRLRSACASGDSAACNAFALKLQKGEYVLRDPALAATLFERACEGGIGDGCASLGIMYQGGAGQRGAGVKRDSARAVSLFQQGCERGGMDACTRLGVLYRRGTGVPRDAARAA